MVDIKADYLFETAWEVCNKVGGIYTVVMSKAALISEKYKKKNYIMIGPYFHEKVREELVEQVPPHELKDVFDELKHEGLDLYYGKWQIKGEPKVILIDFKGLIAKKDEFKKYYWENYGVDSLYSQWDFEEPMMWATAVGKFIEKFCQKNNPDGFRKIALQCHEWMSGFALLYLKKQGVRIGTIFTTHATMLGRSICGGGGKLYDMLETLDPIKEAYNLHIQDKYLTEAACAKTCDVFTTVSEITGLEAEKVLGRKPDVLLLNGLDIEKFPTFEETSIKHRKNRDKIREFISYYFFPHYYFDLSETLNFFIVGRYEYKNKGIDVFIKALAKLNDTLKEEASKKTIIVFFWIPREVHGAKTELSLNKSTFYQMKEFVTENSPIIQNKILTTIMKCDVKCFDEEEKELHEDGLFGKDFLLEAKRFRLNFMKRGNPLLVTHNIPNEEHDAIMRGFLENGLDNKEDDRVKIINYPVYLTGVDGLIDLPYYDAIMGCHLGLFPSYYEPWGYTPLESAALGVPSLTTDLGGFGRFIQSKGKGEEGVFVLKRFGISEEESVNHFSEILHHFCEFNEKQRVKQKMLAKDISNLADWEELIVNYFEAHNKAVDAQWGS